MSAVETVLPPEFFDVAQRVYREDPLWLPESAEMVRLQWQDALQDNGGLRAWFDLVPERARLAGFYDDQQVIDGRRTAFFGFWDALDDLEANQRLFREFEHWARAQGADQVVGPINITTFGNYRVRLNAFEHGAFPGEPYNPPYYASLLEAMGYGVCKRFYSWFGELAGRAAAWAGRMEPVLAELRGQGWRFEPFAPADWAGALDDIYGLVDEIFGQNYAYRGISRQAFERGYGSALAQRFCPYASSRVTDPEGRLAAFFLVFPDYGPLLRQGAQPPLPASRVNFAEHFPQLPQPLLLGKTGGVHPRYRQLGLFGLMTYLGSSWGESRYARVAATLVREDNPSRKVAEAFFSRPGDWRHDYALFAKSL